MFTTEQIKNKIAYFKELHETYQKEVKEFLTDTSFPLKDRWEIFLETGIGDIETYIHRFDVLNNYVRGKHDTINEYLTDYTNKYETVYIEYLEDQLTEAVETYKEYQLEQVGKAEEDVDRYNPSYILNVEEFPHKDTDLVFDEDALNEWKEEVLSKMMKGFNFDW